VRLGDRVFLLSARTARILTETHIDLPRSRRGDSEIASIKAGIARRTIGERAARDAS